MSPRVDAFIDKHGWQILGVLASALIAVTLLQAQVRQIEKTVEEKASVEDVKQVDAKVEDIRYLICLDHRADSRCRR